jgi:hypothetical protein
VPSLWIESRPRSVTSTPVAVNTTRFDHAAVANAPDDGSDATLSKRSNQYDLPLCRPRTVADGTNVVGCASTPSTEPQSGSDHDPTSSTTRYSTRSGSTTPVTASAKLMLDGMQ